MSTLIFCCILQVTLLSLTGLLLAFAVRRPAIQAAVLSTAMLAVGAVTVLAFCPLPTWWQFPLPINSNGTATTTVAESADLPKENLSPVASAARPQSFSNEDEAPQFSLDRLADLLPVPAVPATPEHSASRRGFLWLPLVLMLFGVSRVFLGLGLIHRCSRQSHRITDRRAVGLLQDVQEQANSSHAIELRECRRLRNAAMTGWRRPRVLLPQEWRDWSDEELRAVLAHEVAHIIRRDFPLRVFACFLAAVYAFHPLVYWLKRTLIRQQELAADTMAATMAGGREPYLFALSKMALRQDARPRVWSASVTLPVSSSFLMRRIAMLRAREGRPHTGSATVLQTVSITALVLVTLGVTSLRGMADDPNSTDRTNTVADSSGEKASRKSSAGYTAFDAALLAEPGGALFVVRFAELMQRSELQGYRELYEKQVFGWLKQHVKQKELLLTLDQIELIAAVPQFVLDEREEKGKSSFAINTQQLMVRTTKPYNWQLLIHTLLPGTTAEAHQNTTFFKLPALKMLGPWNIYMFTPDDRTVLFFGSEKRIHNWIAQKETKATQIASGPQTTTVPKWATGSQWKTIDDGLITVALDNQNPNWLQVKGKRTVWQKFTAPLLKQMQFTSLSLDWDKQTDQLSVDAVTVCNTQAEADQTKRLLESILALAATQMKEKADADKASGKNTLQLWPLVQNARLQPGKATDGRPTVEFHGEMKVTPGLIQQLMGEGETPSKK